MNSITLIGRPTKDIETRMTQSGKTVTSFCLACDKNRRNDGTDFFTVVAWEQTAQLLGDYVRKGDLIGIIGRLSSRTYEKNGENRVAVEVVADSVTFLGKKGNNGE